MQQKFDDIKIGLALSGGAALGFAHYGVIKVLEDNGIKPSFVAGTSMGSVMGALYACGLNPYELCAKLDDFSFNKIARLNGLKILKEGLYNTDRMPEYMKKFIDFDLIENAKIPYRCVSVDLVSGKQYVFKKGDFSEAIRASCAMPGIFNPIKKDDMLLVDGGMLNNIPYDQVFDMGAEYVIAVNINPEYKKQDNLNSFDKIVFSSVILMLSDKENCHLKNFPKDKGFLLNINSDGDLMDFSQQTVLSAFNLGVKVAEDNIGKILNALKKFQKQKNKEK